MVYFIINTQNFLEAYVRYSIPRQPEISLVGYKEEKDEFWESFF